MGYTRLTGESASYLDAREKLRLAEIDLMQQRERVAEMRRALPPGPVVDDYEFLEGRRIGRAIAFVVLVGLTGSCAGGSRAATPVDPSPSEVTPTTTSAAHVASRLVLTVDDRPGGRLDSEGRSDLFDEPRTPGFEQALSRAGLAFEAAYFRDFHVDVDGEIGSLGIVAGSSKQATALVRDAADDLLAFAGCQCSTPTTVGSAQPWLGPGAVVRGGAGGNGLVYLGVVWTRGPSVGVLYVGLRTADARRMLERLSRIQDRHMVGSL